MEQLPDVSLSSNELRIIPLKKTSRRDRRPDPADRLANRCSPETFCSTLCFILRIALLTIGMIIELLQS